MFKKEELITSTIYDTGRSIYELAQRLFPICRSITGEGVRQTLSILQEHIPLCICSIPSGTQVFDWVIPKEWSLNDAYIEDMQGNRVISYHKHNLHVLGYSTPVNKVIDRDELLQYVHTLPEQPSVIPYVTSYYQERWGFCMTEYQKRALTQSQYRIIIDSKLKNGVLNYGELIISGQSEKEILFSTYICHPSMANNELSGPCVSTYLAKKVLEQKRKYTYRFIFIPETIGAIAYLSRNLPVMKKNTIAGFNISCVGDDRTYSYIESRYGHTLADKTAQNVLSFHYPQYKHYSFLKRGSDERQFCAPGVDLPVCSICRSKYGEYPEYHTSADNLDLITPAGLGGAYEFLCKCIDTLESNTYYKVNCLCEPQMGKRGLYPTISKMNQHHLVAAMMDFIAYADGSNDLIDISNRIGVPVNELIPIASQLLNNGVVQEAKHTPLPDAFSKE